MSENYLPRKMLNVSARANGYFEIEFLISTKLNEKLYPSHYFLTYDYKSWSYFVVRAISD